MALHNYPKGKQCKNSCGEGCDTTLITSSYLASGCGTSGPCKTHCYGGCYGGCASKCSSCSGTCSGGCGGCTGCTDSCGGCTGCTNSCGGCTGCTDSCGGCTGCTDSCGGCTGCTDSCGGCTGCTGCTSCSGTCSGNCAGGCLSTDSVYVRAHQYNDICEKKGLSSRVTANEHYIEANHYNSVNSGMTAGTIITTTHRSNWSLG